MDGEVTMLRHLQPELVEPRDFGGAIGYALIIVIVALLLLAIFANPALPA